MSTSKLQGDHNDYRKWASATAACAHLIQLCEAAGSSTYWECVRLNAGSRALARKLGFVNQRAYKLLAWFKPRELHFGKEKR